MIFHQAKGFPRGCDPKMPCHLGPHPKIVHIPIGKPPKHFVPTEKIASHFILDEYLRSWLCFLRDSGAKVQFSEADGPLIKTSASTLQLRPRKGFCSRFFIRVKLWQVAAIILFYR